MEESPFHGLTGTLKACPSQIMLDLRFNSVSDVSRVGGQASKVCFLTGTALSDGLMPKRSDVNENEMM